MNRQRRDQWLFGFFVKTIAAVRAVRSGAPIMAGVALFVAGVTIGHLPVDGFQDQVRHAEADALAQEPAAAFGEARSTDRPGASGLPAPVLSREQQNVVSFITATYRVAAEQTQLLVAHAYRTARDLKLDPMLILAVISVESSFDPRAQSQQGAQGLMQVLTRVHADKFSPFGGVAAAFDPLANIRVGAGILKDYLKRDGSVEGALKAYVGAAALPHDGGYGAKVIFERERIAAAASGRPMPLSVPAMGGVAPVAADSVRVAPSVGAPTAEVRPPVELPTLSEPLETGAAETLPAAPLRRVPGDA